MSVPLIPGFTQQPPGGTLADLWQRPPGGFPDRLWPRSVLACATQNPTGWLTLVEHVDTDELDGGCGCILVEPSGIEAALRRTSWFGRDLGNIGVWADDGFDDGLALTEDDVNIEFLAQVRRPVGSVDPLVEIHLPLLWYWDAFPVAGGWNYLNMAGRNQELLRWHVDENGWRLDIRTFELRQFLAACGKYCLMQLDYTSKTPGDPFERVDDELELEWAHLYFHALHEFMSIDTPFSRVMGQYVITGMRNSRVPRFAGHHVAPEYPSFTYGIDPATGAHLRHSCDPDALGTYFDQDDSRLHYLTPVYFKREVLQPYAAEPNRYRLSSHRIECLNLWGTSISFNSIGLVEVYLGDIGRDLPSEEWGHWSSYNVVPEGTMEEGRFRRDFLNQSVSSPDTPGDLKRARARASDASEALLGARIWRPLTGDTRAQFESLIGPLSDDPASLLAPMLLLTKALVDSIDPAPLATYLGGKRENEQSLGLLTRFAEALDDQDRCIQIIRDLQGFRSGGGVAHLAGRRQARAAEALGITGMSTLEAFNSVAERLTASLDHLTTLMTEHTDPESAG